MLYNYLLSLSLSLYLSLSLKKGKLAIKMKKLTPLQTIWESLFHNAYELYKFYTTK